ncbi:MAG: serine hydrolase, partial [Chitinophagales bacterium]
MLDKAQNMVVAYDNESYTQQSAAMALFGALPFKGRLPVATGRYKVNAGVNTAYLGRLKFSIPEEVGIASARLTRIDSIADQCIKMQAAPGCQILVAKDGKVIWDKSYGYTKYDKKEKIAHDNIYDLASVTKICATTLALMQLYDRGKFNAEKSVSDYLPDTQGFVIGGLKMQDVLTHQAGLVAWIPFYKKTLNADQTLNALYYNQSKIPGFEVQVADNVFMRTDYMDTMWQIIKTTPLKQPGKYVYSDLGMFIARRVIERIANATLDAYVQVNFYNKLGLRHTGFNPLQFADRKKIVPTEDDNYFRYQLVHGYVHDMGAAMMNGVEGHAGLFSNAEDVAIILQMLLNGGTYGGETFFSRETVEKFTAKQSSVSRRGLGFDKPDKNPGNSSPASSYASGKTYGHLGFTGICAWVDPQYNLIYIFLSNRVYPKSD